MLDILHRMNTARACRIDGGLLKYTHITYIKMILHYKEVLHFQFLYNPSYTSQIGLQTPIYLLQIIRSRVGSPTSSSLSFLSLLFSLPFLYLIL